MSRPVIPICCAEVSRTMSADSFALFVFQGPSRLAIAFALLDALSLVELLLSLGDSYLDFDQPALIIHLYRHYCQPSSSLEICQLVKLCLAQKQLAGANRVIVLGGVGHLEGRDVHLYEEALSAPDYRMGSLEGGAVGAKGLNLESEQFDAGLESLEDLVIEEGLFVLGEGH